MNVELDDDLTVARIASAIGEPARTRILYCLLDDRARTSTELSVVANVSPSTASVHLNRLKTDGLIKVHVQGKHRYYSLRGVNVAQALEALSVIAGRTQKTFVPNTPNRLRFARTCYDHMAGTVSVLLHDRFREQGLVVENPNNKDAYDVSVAGAKTFEALGIDLESTSSLRRRFAFGCLDWSERQPHIGGGLGAALLQMAVKRKWVERDLDSRALTVTNIGRREMIRHFDVEFQNPADRKS